MSSTGSAEIDRLLNDDATLYTEADARELLIAAIAALVRDLASLREACSIEHSALDFEPECPICCAVEEIAKRERQRPG